MFDMTKGTATDKQISFALSLLSKAGMRTDYMDRSYSKWATMRQRSGTVRDWLAGMQRHEISNFIDQLKAGR